MIKRVFNKLAILLTIAFFLSSTGIDQSLIHIFKSHSDNIAYANTTKSVPVSFPASSSRNRSQTINIPNLRDISSITVNTGSVSYSVSGEQVTVNVSGGSIVDSDTPSTTASDTRTNSTNSFPSSISYNDSTYSGTLYKSGSSASYVASGSYTPSDSKTVTQVGYGSTIEYYNWTGTAWSGYAYASAQCPSSISYNDGTYSGTLNVSGSGWKSSPVIYYSPPTGSAAGAYAYCYYENAHNYTGTVTKPAVDTRVWEYSQEYSGTVYGSTTNYYAYTVTIEYSEQYVPTIVLDSPLDSSYYTNIIPIIARVCDVNSGDVLTLKYIIDNLEGHSNIQIGETTNSTGQEQLIQGNILINDTIPEGTYNLRTWCEDSTGRKSQEILRTVKIDKYPPVIKTCNIDSYDTSISISALAEDTIFGLDLNSYRYSIGSKISDWIPDNTFVSTALIPNTLYNVKIEAKDKVGLISSLSKSICTKAQIPSIKLENPSLTTIDLNITDSNPETTDYQIMSGEFYVNSEGKLILTPTWIKLPNKKIIVDGLNSNKSYFFSAKAKNLEGIKTKFSMSEEGKTQSNLPNTPLNINANTGTTSITITWDAVNGVSEYDIESNGIIKTVKTTSYQHIGLTPNTQYSYRVRARNPYGVSEWSPIITGTTANNPPGEVLNLNAYLSNEKIILTWDVVQDAQSYEVEFDGIVIDNGVDTFCTKSGLLPMTQHTYRVRGINTVGEGNWSSLSTISTLMLSTPVNIKVIESENEIELVWDKVEAATEYCIEVNGQVIGTTATNSYKHTGLTVETRYTYRIKAKNINGESAWSDSMSTMTLPIRPKVPENIRAHSVHNLITIMWGSVGNAIGYDVELDGVLIDNGNNVKYMHEDLTKSSYHTYRVRTKSDAIEGEWSKLLTIKTVAGQPEYPQNIEVESTNTITTLTWEAQKDALAYDIEVDGQIIENLTQTSYRHRRIMPGTEHVYRIRTKNVTGISQWSGYIINNALRAACKKGNVVDLGLTASNIVDFSKYTLTVTYNPQVIEVTDLSTLSPQIELKSGKIEGTGITITEYSPGKIVFIVDKKVSPGESWTGVINSIKFMSKVTGGTNITYTVFGKSEDVTN